MQFSEMALYGIRLKKILRHIMTAMNCVCTDADVYDKGGGLCSVRIEFTFGRNKVEFKREVVSYKEGVEFTAKWIAEEMKRILLEYARKQLTVQNRIGSNGEG